MGLFDFLFGRYRSTNVEQMPDRIWLTPQAKFTGIAREVAECARSDTTGVLLVAHFPDVLSRLSELTEQDSAVPVVAVLARDLSTDIASRFQFDESALIDIIVGERHPTASADAELVRFAEQLPCRCRLVHHVSLEDPLMSGFAGDWVRNVLKDLGMQDDEAIEGRMVSRRIRAAQLKIEKQTLGEASADSAAEWLEKNCPGGENR